MNSPSEMHLPPPWMLEIPRPPATLRPIRPQSRQASPKLSDPPPSVLTWMDIPTAPVITALEGIIRKVEVPPKSPPAQMEEGPDKPVYSPITPDPVRQHPQARRELFAPVPLALNYQAGSPDLLHHMDLGTLSTPAAFMASSLFSPGGTILGKK